MENSLAARLLREAIEATKEQSNERPHVPQVDRIRELSRKHFELTGAPGDRGK